MGRNKHLIAARIEPAIIQTRDMKIWIAMLVIAPCLFAHGDQKNCEEVSGGIVD